GVGVEGRDRAGDAGDTTRRTALEAALADHGVVCVRLPAALDEDEARALASMLGPIKDPVGRARDGSPLRYGDSLQVIDSGFVVPEELRADLARFSLGGDSVRPGLFESFHSADSYTDPPASATVPPATAL